MKKMSVLIVSSDEDYCRNVMRYFKRHYNDSVMIMVCDTPQYAVEYIRNNGVAIVLTDDSFTKDLSSAVKDRCEIYTLVEKNGTEEQKTFSKYISAPQIYKDLLYIYSKSISDEDEIRNVSAVPIYAFISVNGCGATTLSASFAKYLAGNGRKVLYLGLDGLSDYSAILSMTSQKGLSDIIMALKARTGNASLAAKSVTVQGDVNFIDKCRNADDLYELSESETETLLDKIIGSDEYGAVVLDLSFAYPQLWNYCAKRATAIFAVTVNMPSSITKTNNFIETLKIRDFRKETDAYGKLSVLVNKTGSDKPNLEINCSKLYFVPRHSANDYTELTNKLSGEKVWKEFFRG